MDALLLDGLHPNTAGHRLVADALLALLVTSPVNASLK
jgi:lysophospholipase L1-like esterase